MSRPLMREADRAQRAAADPGASAWVAASAGTGKTKVLTDRALALMLAGTPPARLLCLTFTKAAAAEMANRLAEVLGLWATDDDAGLDAGLLHLLGRAATGAERARARRLFADVLDTPGGMNIQTLHAFCQSVLRRFPLEAGLAPHFAVMDERDALEMLAAAREETLAKARLGDEGLARALARVTRHASESAFAELMAALANERARLGRLLARSGGAAGAALAARRLLGLGADETPEGVVATAAGDDAFDALGLRLACAALAKGTDGDRKRAQVIADWLARPAAARAAAFDRYADAFLANKQSTVRKTLATQAVAAGTPGLAEILADEAERLLGAVERRRAAVTTVATEALLALAQGLLDSYEAHKRSRALLDYDDLILRTRELLRRPGVAPWVLFKLDGGIDHVLIDEAQDTNPDQWQVVAAIVDEFFAGIGTREGGRTVFAVGDVKQSIFSFQRADPAAFEAMRGRFAAQAEAAGESWREVPLTVSFRSTPAVLRAVDAVFERDEARTGVALDGHPIRHRAFRGGDAGSVELWPPVEARETDAPAPWKPPVERFPGDSPPARLARLLARRIRALLDSGDVLPSRGRPVRPGDVMVLVRRRGAFVEELVRAIKELAVAVAGVDRMVLTEQMAVMDLVALGRFLLLPEDDLMLATVLKGPLIGLDDDRLYALAHGRPASLWQALGGASASDPAFSAVRDRLAGLLARADQVPPFELFADVLGAGGGRARLVARLGRDALDPIAEFLGLALAYERTHAASLQGFLHWVEAGAVEVKRDLEQTGDDAVRVLTVHGAKGLQAPVVFLPDTLQAPTAGPRLLWPGGADGEVLLWPPDRAAEEAVATAERQRVNGRRDDEYRRLLYVAMTRAEDRLIVCGWGTRKGPPAHCWYNLVRDGLSPIAEEVEDAFLAAAGETASSRILRVTSAQTAALREAGEARPGRPPAPMRDWARAPAPAEEAPPRPLAPSRPEGEEPVPGSSPGIGARFRRGRLIHRLLQTLPELAPERRRAAAEAWLARPVHGLDAGARAEILAKTLAVLDHPDMAPLLAPGSRAEVPIVGVVGGRVVSGQVDRLSARPDAVFVVDYKTDRAPPATEGEVAPLYLAQMAAYRAVLGGVFPGRPVRCLLLWTDGPRLMTLTDAALDLHAP